MKSIAALTAILLICVHIPVVDQKTRIQEQWNQMTYEEQLEADVAIKAYVAGMDVDDFILISSVTEAESDRSNHITGKMLIALTILNRVDSSSWPNSIRGVVTQSGQFTTVHNGRSCASRTNTSDIAVIRAVEWNNTGNDPDIQFFNCVGFNNPYPYCESYGNYFMYASEQPDAYFDPYAEYAYPDT